MLVYRESRHHECEDPKNGRLAMQGIMSVSLPPRNGLFKPTIAPIKLQMAPQVFVCPLACDRVRTRHRRRQLSCYYLSSDPIEPRFQWLSYGVVIRLR